MNERIQKLIEECTDRHFYENGGGFETFDKEKFAELIVRECAKVVNDTEYPYENQSYKNVWESCCVWSAEKLKEHFEVEE